MKLRPKYPVYFFFIKMLLAFWWLDFTFPKIENKYFWISKGGLNASSVFKASYEWIFYLMIYWVFSYVFDFVLNKKYEKSKHEDGVRIETPKAAELVENADTYE